jgi:hypothetical protein
MHGGVISALADNAMGLSIIETLRHQGISRGRGGSGAGIGFADCLILADSQIIARGNATYRFYEDTKGD